MATGLVFFSCFFVCFFTSFAYDLNHVNDVSKDIKGNDVILSRHKRQAENVISNFVSNLDRQEAAFILMIDRSKYVDKRLFHTEVVELAANVLRYHVLNNKVLILTFANLVSMVHDGFRTQNDWNKCRLFEGSEEIWSKITYKPADEALDPGKNFGELSKS